jgi:hypothetical protein
MYIKNILYLVVFKCGEEMNEKEKFKLIMELNARLKKDSPINNYVE